VSIPHNTAFRGRSSFPTAVRSCCIVALHFLAGLLPSVAADAPAAAATTVENAEVITSGGQFWGLNGTAGDREYPLHAQINVLYYDSDWNVMWVDWDGNGSYLSPGTRPLPVKSGQRIEIDGFARPGRQQIDWERTTIRVVADPVAMEPLPLPDPLVRPMDFNLRLVTVEGLISEQIDVDQTHFNLVLVSPDWAITVIVYVEPGAPIPQLRGSFARMHGVFTVRDDATQSTTGLEMWIPKTEHIRVISWLADDGRFNKPRTLIENLADAPRDTPVRVEGVVHSIEPGVSLTMRDETGEVRLLTRQGFPAEPGARIEAIGYPAFQAVESRLTRSIFRAVGTDSEPVRPVGGSTMAMSRLRLTDQIRQLDPAEASRGYPVDIRGVVTWSDPATGTFFIVDSRGGIKAVLPADGSIAPPKFPTDIILKGQTQPGDFVPVVRVTELAEGGVRTLPAAQFLTFAQAMTGSEYGEWSEIRGYVRSVTHEEGDLARVELTTPGGEFVALVRGLSPDHGLVGALVRIRGVCDAIVNDRRQLAGVQFWVTSPDLIQIQEQAPADLFTTPHRSIGSLLQFGAARELNHRLQTSGSVVLHRPGVLLYIEEGDDRLLVLSRQTEPLQPGDRVKIVGIPGQEAGRLIMRDAVYQRTGSGPAPIPRTLEEPERARIDLDGMTVRIRGRLLDQNSTGPGTQLRLQSGTTIFEANQTGDGDRALLNGSILEVTGVYRVLFDEYREPRAFTLDLRYPADVRVVARPSWWTPSRVLWIASGMLAAVLLTAGWGVSLARKNQLLREAEHELHRANAELETRVAARTQDLRLEIAQRRASEETLAQERQLLRTLIDSLPVYLYVKNTAGRFVIGNLPHAKLLGAASGLDVVGKTDFDLHPPELAKRYEEADQRVFGTGESLLLHEEPSSILGQPGWFSTTKVPLRDRSGRITGLIGISQDITERKLAESQRDVLQQRFAQSLRQAGMAEVATGVLHNVGNVLNSVNVSSTLVRETLRNSEIASLSRVAGLLRDRAGDIGTYLTTDPKGRLLPGFVIQLADHLAKEHALLCTEQEHLSRNIEHIKGIVAMQQNYASVSGVHEKVSIAELLGDALQIHSVSLVRHRIEVVRDYAELPPIILDKHKAMQILVNLIHNAKQALEEAGRSDGRITVRIGQSGEARFQIAVTDNGVGIPAENLTRIFSHGFTTRRDGHGFGLHSGANAAREMGGSLRVESAGTGLGATFTLELPITNGTALS